MDGKLSELILRGRTNWDAACPPPQEGQRGERWDLLHKDGGHTYGVISSTVNEDGETLQLHHFIDSSEYMELFRDISDYSRTLKHEKEHDDLTGLYNKRKFLAMKQSLFRRQKAIAVFNLDVNNLKYMNDHFGHEAGDKLIRKAAESMKRIEARNVMPFRVGGDEFMIVALHVDRAGFSRTSFPAALRIPRWPPCRGIPFPGSRTATGNTRRGLRGPSD